MVVYYLSVLSLLLFFTDSLKRRVLLLTVMLIMSIEPSMFSYWNTSLSIGFYTSGIINEILSCSILVLFLRYHKNYLIFLPYILSGILNYIYYSIIEWTPLETILAEDIYYYLNLLLFESIIIICLYQTILPECTAILKDKVIRVFETMIYHFRVSIYYKTGFLL